MFRNVSGSNVTPSWILLGGSTDWAAHVPFVQFNRASVLVDLHFGVLYLFSGAQSVCSYWTWISELVHALPLLGLESL